MPFSKIRIQAIIYSTAFLSGVLLMFGSTDFSFFEVLAVAIALVTTYLVIVHNLFAYLPLSRQNYILFGFAVLTFLQFWLIPETDTLFTLATLYLIGVYALTQFWIAKDIQIQTYLISGYVGGAIISSVFGISAYLNAIFKNDLSDLRFYWEDNIRISVFFDDPVVYGAFLVPGVLILSAKAFLSTNRQEYFLYLFATLLVFSNLILTGSRGAWLNLMVAGGVFLLLYTPFCTKHVLTKLAGVAIPAFVLALILIFVIPIGDKTYYAATLEHRYGSSDKPRIENLQSAPERLTQRETEAIVFGSGSGTYEKTTPQGFSAHNTYLRVLYEQGVVGILLYVLFLFFALKTVFTQRESRSLFATLLFAVLAGILVQNFFVDTLHWRHFWLIVGLIL